MEATEQLRRLSFPGSPSSPLDYDTLLHFLLTTIENPKVYNRQCDPTPPFTPRYGIRDEKKHQPLLYYTREQFAKEYPHLVEKVAPQMDEADRENGERTPAARKHKRRNYKRRERKRARPTIETAKRLETEIGMVTVVNK